MSLDGSELRLLLRARRLTKSYGTVDAVRGVDLDLFSGDFLCLLGPNGAGKTTLLNLLAGTARPDSGTLEFPAKEGDPGGPNPRGLNRGGASGVGNNGVGPNQNANKLARRATVRAREGATGPSSHIGILSHKGFLYDQLTAQENLHFYGRLFGVRDLKNRVAEQLERMNLSSRAQSRTAELSQGMRRRLALARTLLHDPEIILLDEPFAGLDTRSVRSLSRLLEELGDGSRSVVLITHHISQGLSLSSRVMIIAQGAVAWEGASSDLPSDPQTFYHRILDDGAGHADA